MSEGNNPYAPPKSTVSSELGDPASRGMWREGKILIMQPTARFPKRCVKCNQPAMPKPRKVTLYWHPQGYYFLVLLNILIYAIVASIVRKRATLYVGLCQKHRNRLRIVLITAIAGPLLAIGCAMSGAFHDSPGAGVAFGLLGLLWLILIVAWGRLLYARRIDEQYIRISGCGKEFLDTLPPMS